MQNFITENYFGVKRRFMLPFFIPKQLKNIYHSFFPLQFQLNELSY